MSCTRETLDQSFDKLAETALRIKRDRDELLAVCKKLLKYVQEYPEWASIPPRIGSLRVIEDAQRVIENAEGKP